MAKTTDLNSINTIAVDDLIQVVDVSDPAMSEDGTNKSITLSGLANSLSAAGFIGSAIEPGTIDQYYRGDKEWATLNATAVGLGNVTNQSKETMFSNPTFTGNVSGVSKAMVGLGLVDNESKASMFTNPTFTGIVSGITKDMVGLGNVENETKATMFTNPVFTGTTTIAGSVVGITKSTVGLGFVDNESKETMFTNPAFTGTPTAPTAAPNTSTTQIATTGFVTNAVTNISQFKNKIINGNFNIWQRGITFSSATSAAYQVTYLADRWRTIRNGSSFTLSRQSFTPGQTAVPNEPTYFHRTTVTSVANSNNYVMLSTYMEDVRTLAGKSCTLTFYAKADTNKPMSVCLGQMTNSSPYTEVTGIGSQKINLTSSWQKFTLQFNVPPLAGNIGSATNSAMGVEFWFDAGSNWNIRSATLGQQSGTFDIAQVQLEEGSIATSFEQCPFGLELSLCQRYYEVVNVAMTRYNISGNWGGALTNIPFAVPKRAANYSLIKLSLNAASGGVFITNANIDINDIAKWPRSLGENAILLYNGTGLANPGDYLQGAVAIDADLY